MVKIKKSAYEGMISHAESGYPFEVCGVMIGNKDLISYSRECINLISEDSIETEFKSENQLNRERLRDRFELDPKSFMEADEWARENSLEIMGIYHSHPDHPSKPSETDRKIASPGWGYIIFSINQGNYNDARLWYLDESDSQFALTEFELID
ncbi:MAG: Mov34/MPN/PAD-1 family protein [Thermodesulfobacteriota bacterium]